MFATKITKKEKIKRTIKNVFASAALVSSLLFATTKTANASSVELMVGNKSATADLKESIDLTKKLGLFFRLRPTVDYCGKISAFGLADLILKLKSGLDAAAEVQFIEGVPVPRVGLQYFAKRGDFSFFTLDTAGLNNNPYFELLTTVNYNPNIYKALNLIVQVENITDLESTGNNGSTQRIRLGFTKQGWGIGPAIDLTETGNHPNLKSGTFGWNAGGFVSGAFE